MQAYLSVRFSLSDGDIQRIEEAQCVLSELRDAITKTGENSDAKKKLQDAIVLLTDIVSGKEI